MQFLEDGVQTVTAVLSLIQITSLEIQVKEAFVQFTSFQSHTVLQHPAT